jgi:hypothetical protein
MNNAYLHSLSSELPLFSVIIPAYNAEKTLAAAINSAVCATVREQCPAYTDLVFFTH